jgi:SAM-dependent methyltransferase
MQKTQTDWYDTPLYYDIIFDAGTPKEADFLDGLYARHGKVASHRARAVLEPACGSGRLMLAMAERGWAAWGFDGSEAMLGFARSRGSQHSPSKLWLDQLQSFNVPKAKRFHLAHCLVSTFKYLLSEADAVAHLQRVADALLPGGIYALGIHLTDYAATHCTHERWVAERDEVHVVCNTRGWPADRMTRLEAVRTRLKITHSGETRVQETRWQFRTYNAAQVKALLSKVPALELVACHDFTYDLASTRKLDDSYSDVLLVLRRR